MAVAPVKQPPHPWVEFDPVVASVLSAALVTSASACILCPGIDLKTLAVVSGLISGARTYINLPVNEDTISLREVLQSAAKLGCLFAGAAHLTAWINK